MCPTGYNVTLPENRKLQITANLLGMCFFYFLLYHKSPLFLFLRLAMAFSEETWMGRKRYEKTAGYLVQAPCSVVGSQDDIPSRHQGCFTLGGSFHVIGVITHS